MSQKRYHIRDGAKTTAGGTVRASSQFFKVNGVALAREGDPVDCPACGARGFIKCVMPRLPDRFEGKEYALSDDLCICGCNPPPKLIADQNFKCQYVTPTSAESTQASTVRGAESPATSATAARTNPTGAAPVEEQELRRILFVDRGSNKAYTNRPYRLALTDGKRIQGTTDAQGGSSPLSEEERTTLRGSRAGRP